MTNKIPVSEFRKRLGHLLNGMARRRDDILITRRGKPVARLVPAERLDQMRRFARHRAGLFMQQQRGGPLSDQEAMDLACEAQSWARAQARTAR